MPPGLHFAVTNNNIDQMDNLVKELKQSIETLEAMSIDELNNYGSGPGI